MHHVESPTKSAMLMMRLIARIDDLISAQCQRFLHAPAFLQLEARWRGLHYLVQQNQAGAQHRQQIRVLSLTEREVFKDLTYISDFEQSFLFQQLYSVEYDLAGGHPYGLIVFDYDLSFTGRLDWTDALSILMQIGAACFAPVLCQVSPSCLGLDSFQDISAKINWHALLNSTAQRSWHRLRKMPDARYINLLCQRVLWRTPYSRRYQGNFNLTFEEKIHSHHDLCWGSAAYLIAGLALQSFHQTAWFADLNAMQTQMHHYFSPFDSAQISPLGRLEVCLDQAAQSALSKEGFTLLTENSFDRALRLESSHAFYMPPAMQDQQQNDNAWIACLLPYLLCACRFAHYLKIIGREKVGSMLTTEDLESYLQNWLYQYCGKADYYDEARMAKYPLASGRIQIAPHPIDPTHYICKMDLKPNCRVENIDARLRLISAIQKGF